MFNERIARTVHRYGDHSSQLGELFPVRGAPVAVVIHGGFWRDGYDRSLMDGLCDDLASAGWAAWNREYRRLGGGGGWPETFEDVAAGIDHLDQLVEDMSVVVHEGLGHFEHLDPRSVAWQSVRAWLAQL